LTHFSSREGALARLGPLAAAFLVAGCGLFGGGQTPSPTPTPVATPTPVPTPVPTPTLQPNPVGAITLVGAVGEFEPASRSELVWAGVQAAAQKLGITPKKVSPISPPELSATIPAAAAAAAATPELVTVLVTVGPAGAQAALAAAAEHPTVVFLTIDEQVADDAPSNVHAITFDDVEAGYLAGVIAGGISTSGVVGFVAGVEADPVAAAYLAGLRNGVVQGSATASVSPAYAGTTQDPQKGRAAVDGLVDSGAGVIVAMPDLTGYGAMRQACAHEIPLVALGTEAADLLPDVQPCLVASILRRYDVAVRDAILDYAAGHPMPRLTVGNVAGGAVAPGPFTNPIPPDVSANLRAVIDAMLAGPPRPTPAPIETSTPGPDDSTSAAGSA
jgi:basic membrane protein A